MKVLVLIDAWFPFVGGAQIQIRELRKILEKKYDCHYFILHSPAVNLLTRFLWLFWAIPQAVWLNRRHHFDLIHAHSYWPGIPGKIISRLLKLPVVFTVHGSHLLDLRAHSPRAFLEKIILTKIKYDQVISVSAKLLEYQNVNQNIEVIANGVDINKFKRLSSPLAPPGRGRGRAKARNPRFKVLFVGRLERQKNLESLVKAVSLLSREHKIKLLFIGQGRQKSQLIITARRISSVCLLWLKASQWFF